MSRLANRRIHVTAFAVGIAFFWVALYTYVPILGVHARDLGASDTLVGLIVGSYGFTQLLLRIPLGIFSDKLGARKIFVSLGFIAVVLSALGLALSKTPLQMLASRSISGVAASSWVAATVMFSAYYPPDEAVRSTSVMSFASSFGQMLATLAGGYIAAAMGMQAPFLVAALVGLIGLLVIAPTAEQKAQRERTPSFRQILSVLTYPTLLLVSLVAAVVQYSSFATSYAFVPIFADEVLFLSETQIGVLTSVVLLPYVFITTVVATISTRVREEWLVAIGLLLLSSSTVITPFTTGFTTLLSARALFGLGMGLTYPVLMGLSIKTVAQEQRASAMGAFQAIYAIGMTAGPALSGFISDHLSLASVFWVTAAMCLFGLPLLWMAATRIPGKRKARPL